MTTSTCGGWDRRGAGNTSSQAAQVTRPSPPGHRTPIGSRSSETTKYGWWMPRDRTRGSVTERAHGTPCWSPDGDFIVFPRGPSIYVVPTAGGQARRIEPDDPTTGHDLSGPPGCRTGASCSRPTAITYGRWARTGQTPNEWASSRTASGRSSRSRVRAEARTALEVAGFARMTIEAVEESGIEARQPGGGG
jgi:hypothetical protein